MIFKKFVILVVCVSFLFVWDIRNDWRSNEFYDCILSKILDRVLEYVPKNQNFTIHLINSWKEDPCWAYTVEDFKEIYIDRKIVKIVDNEAELVSVIAHEACHGLDHSNKDNSITKQEKEIEIDLAAIKLMARMGYDTRCDYGALKKVVDEQYKTFYPNYRNYFFSEGPRMAATYFNANSFFKKGQRKWIIFSKEEFDQLRSMD